MTIYGVSGNAWEGLRSGQESSGVGRSGHAAFKAVFKLRVYELERDGTTVCAGEATAFGEVKKGGGPCRPTPHVNLRIADQLTFGQLRTWAMLGLFWISPPFNTNFVL
jgi:hypothetical protein